jgi:hypothetical protein
LREDSTDNLVGKNMVYSITLFSKYVEEPGSLDPLDQEYDSLYFKLNETLKLVHLMEYMMSILTHF